MKRNHWVVAFALLAIVSSCTTPDTLSPRAEAPPAVASPANASADWRTWGFEPKDGAPSLPYRSDQAAPIDVADTDSNGVVTYQRNGVRHPHPVAYAQYALKMLNSWHVTSDETFLDRAVANGEAMLDAATRRDGRIWLPYEFDFPLHGDVKNTIHAPWWSAMAQGQALSLFVRLHEATGDDRWDQAAEEVFQTFLDVHDVTEIPTSDPWAVFIADGGWLWLEEYAGDVQPMRVLNGHIFAMYGLYDYWLATQDRRAAELFDGAATTVARHVPQLRNPGEASWYGMRVQDNPTAQSEKYHRIHTIQLRQLGDLTSEPLFDALADLLADDFD